MDKRKPLEDHDPLAEPMRRKAQRTRPEFSHALDARLRAAVRSVRSLGPPAAVAFHRKLPARLLSWAVSAAISVALLVCLALFFHTPGQPIGPSTVQTRHGDPAQPTTDDIESTADLVENAATGLGQWVQSSVDDSQWAGLDRDAKAAIETVTAPLPFDFSLAVSDADPERQEK